MRMIITMLGIFAGVACLIALAVIATHPEWPEGFGKAAPQVVPEKKGN